MNAIEFQNTCAKCVKYFFYKCLDYEQLTIREMQEITICFNEYGFELRLKTDYYSFVQKFNVENNNITPIHFEANKI